MCVVNEEPGIFPYDFLGVGRVTTVLDMEFAAAGGHAERLVLAHGKMHGVHEVNSPVGNAAAAEIIEIAPTAGMIAFAERNGWRRSEPEVPIHRGGRGGIRGGRAFPHPFVNPALHIMN